MEIDFELHKNRLASLIQSALTLDVICEPRRRNLSEILRKIQEDQFRFALVGEFQCGKSTLFNALCDGRDLSPQGFGVKTSGCAVFASNMSDRSKEEFASVKWRTAGEMGDGVFHFLSHRLGRLSEERFRDRYTENRPAVINLDNSKDRDLLMSAIQAEWDKWRQDRAGYDLDRRGLLDVLRCATFIVQRWADDSLDRLRDKSMVSLEKAREWMTFPQDWEVRWMAGDPDQFSVDEMAFLFIRSIRLYLHSPGLSRLGCVIVDCPGLFASRWDTQVAREVMADADAILYLFDGSRPLKRSDLKALAFIQNNNMARKLFYGCNLRGLSATDSQRVVEASLTSLEQAGFSAPPDRVAAFHARLGLASARAERCLQENSQWPADEDGALLMADIQRLLVALRPDLAETSPWSDLTPADCFALARDESGLDQLMAMAETAVIKKKAWSILIDNGADIVLAALQEADGTLRSQEQAARMEVKSFRHQAEKAEMALRRFEEQCRLAVGRLDDPSADAALAQDFWSQIPACRESLCEVCALRIRQEVLTRHNIAALALKRQSIQDRIIQIIQSEMEARFETIASRWLAEVQDGRNPVYNLRVARQVEAVSRELKSIWTQSDLAEMDMLSGVSLPSFSGVPAVERERLFQEMAEREIMTDIRNQAIAAASLAGVFTAASGLLAGVLAAMSRVVWMAVASAAVLLVNGLILLLTKGMVKETLESEIRSRLSPAFIRIFNDMEPEITSAFKAFSADVRALYMNAFTAAVEAPRALFEKRRQQAEAGFKIKRMEREASAREARQKREEDIAPLVAELEAFKTAFHVHHLENHSSETVFEL